MEHRHFLKVAAVLCLLAAVAVTHAQEDRLSLLVEKALERESLFDGVEARFQMEGSPGRGGRGGRGGRSGWGGRGGRGGRGGVRSPQGTGGTPPRSTRGGGEGAGQGWRRSPRGGGAAPTRTSSTYTIQGHFASYAGSVSMTAQFSSSAESGSPVRTMRQVSSGEITKGLIETANGSRGYVSADAGMTRMRAPTPDRMGITGLPFTSGSMVDHLSGASSEFSYSFRGNTARILTRRQAAYVGEEIIDGRSVLVVEVTETTLMRNRTRESVERLYFAEELNYACVRTERGRVRDGEFRMTNRWEFTDFEEVKPGLFVPFSAESFRLRGEGEPVRTLEYNLLSLEFPGSFDEGVFKLEFPDGTVVRDRIAALSFTAGELPFDDVDLLFLDELPEAEAEAPAGEAVASPATPEQPPAAAAAVTEECLARAPWVAAAAIVALGMSALAIAGALFRTLRKGRGKTPEAGSS